MSKEKPAVKIGQTPQGQTTAETPHITAPGTHYTRWAWSALLSDPALRYGSLSSPRYVTDLIKLNMLYDPVIAMACGFTGTMLLKAKREIVCEDENKRQFFEAVFRMWEREFILQANMAIAMGSAGLVKIWEFKNPTDQLGNSPWKGTSTPFIITGYQQCYPTASQPIFDDKNIHFEGIESQDGKVDRFNSLWITIGKEKAFGDYQGWGRLNNVYNDWWIKNVLRDSYIIGIQKNANPAIMSFFPPGKDDATGVDNSVHAQNTGNALQAGATVSIPSEVYETENFDTGEPQLSTVRKWAVEFLEGGKPLTQYPELEDHHNRMEAMGYLLPPQAVMDVTGGDLGGPTSADKLLNLGTELLMQDAADIDRHVNEYVFPDISAANFPPDSPPVTVQTVGLDEANVNQLFELVKLTLPDNPTVFPVPEALERLNLPINREAANNPPSQPPTQEKAALAAQGESVPAGVDPVTGKVDARGKPLEAQSDDPVPISVEDIARAVGLWDENAPREARGLLVAQEIENVAATSSYALGGPGSGNWAHVGRKGKVGGSGSRSSGMTIGKGKDWLERYKQTAGRPHPYELELKKGKGEEETPATTAKKTYYTGDPQKQSMQDLFDGAPNHIQKMAIKSGILALDDVAEKYVSEKIKSGEINNDVFSEELEWLAADWASLSENIDRDFERAEENLLAGTGHSISKGMQELVRRSDIIMIARQNGIDAGGEAANDKLSLIPEKFHDIVLKAYSNHASQRLDAVVRVSKLSDVEKKELVNSMRGVAEVEVINRHLDSGKLVNNYGGNQAPYIKTSEAVLKNGSVDIAATIESIRNKVSQRISVETLTALRAPSKETRAEAQQLINSTWDRKNHRFSATTNNVFEIVAQQKVRDNYQKIVDAKNNVMETGFHGTHYGAAASIAGTGFKVPKRAKAGRMLGDGVYLANTSSKSIQYIGLNYGKGGGVTGILFFVKAARGKEATWTTRNTYSNKFDTLFAPSGKKGDLLNDEWVIRNPEAVLPYLWIDITRK